MPQVFQRLMSLLDRSERDRTRLADGSGVRLKTTAFAIFILGLLAAYLPPVIEEMRLWLDAQADLPLKGDSGWRVLYDAQRDPGNPALWSSTIVRSGSGHEDRLKAYQGSAYWLGLTLSPETLRQAGEKHAGLLAIGHILAPYQIWANGELFIESRGATDPSPVFLPISSRWLTGDRPLRVAIRVEFNRLRIPPDHFCNGIVPGLYSQETAAGFLTMSSFWDRVRPFTLFISYTLISALFFFFWLPAPQKQEYFYLALFALSSAALQAQSTDFLRWRRDPGVDDTLTVVFYSWMAGFGLLMALSFARLRTIVFRVGTPLVILVPPLLLALVSQDMASRAALRAWIKAYGLSSAFLLGGLVCFAQSRWVGLVSRHSRAAPVRARRLGLFGMGMIGLAALYFLQGNGLIPSGDRFFWRGFEQFGVILFFASIALREYGEQENRLRKSPVSEYHQRPVLPDQVSGALLVADLKNSEPFYRSRATDDGENLIFSWRSQFYNSVLRQKGLILATKGDEVIAFFPSDRCEEPALNALRAVDSIDTDSRLLTEQCLHQEALPAGARGFFFRATICEGSLKPVWETIGPHRDAAWEDAGHSSPFVDSARLIDLERQVPGTHSERTLVILPCELAARLAEKDSGLSTRIILRQLSLADKHGIAHPVAVYEPGSDTGTTLAA